MVRRWSYLNEQPLYMFFRLFRVWSSPKLLYKRIIKLKKYKFFKFARIRSNRRRKFGNFRNSLTQIRFFYNITLWSVFLNLKYRYKSYIWLISYKNFFLPNFERYSAMQYNRKFWHPVRLKQFYNSLEQVFGPDSLPIAHRTSVLKVFSRTKTLNIWNMFLTNVLLQNFIYILNIYTVIQYKYLNLLAF